MTTKIKFDWGDEVIIDDETFCPDCLGRQRYAAFLASFLEGQNTNKPYVLNLNSSWGTGKTYFLKRWKDDVGKKHPIVYIDAWKNDSSGDPFMVVISAIISQLRSQTEYPDDTFFQKGIAQSTRILKQIGPLVIGALAKRYLGDSIEKAFNDEIKIDVNNKISEAATKIATSLISEHEKRADSIKALKASITSWIGSVRGHRKKVDPTFIIIDELDRCRPSYAVETLEVVKHIFDIPGVFFIIATDTEQLQHAIKVVYGHGFNAQIYLSRFFDSRFTLPAASLETVIMAHCNTMYFGHEFQQEKKVTLWPENDDLLKTVTTIVDLFEITARDAIQIVNRTCSVLLHAKEGSIIDLIYLVTLLCLQKKDYSFYTSIVTAKRLDDISSFYNEKPWLASSKFFEFTFSHKDIGSEVCRRNLSLKKYYQLIFASYSNNFISNGRSLSVLDTADITMSANITAAEIFTGIKMNNCSLIDEENTDAWVQYSYVNMGLHKVKKEKYKDWVELATSFDE